MCHLRLTIHFSLKFTTSLSPGWFAVLGSAEDDKAERVVPHFSRVGNLAMSKCERFLVGGKEPITAVQTPSPRHGTEGHTQSRMVSPGDVLKMGKLYVGETTVNVSSHMI